MPVSPAPGEVKREMTSHSLRSPHLALCSATGRGGSPFRGFPPAAAMHGTPKLSCRLTTPVEHEAVHGAVQQAHLSPDPAAAAAAECSPLRAGLRQLPGLRVNCQNPAPSCLCRSPDRCQMIMLSFSRTAHTSTARFQCQYFR